MRQDWGGDWEVDAEIKQGLDDLDAYMSKQAAFEAYLEERGNKNAPFRERPAGEEGSEG